MHAINKVLADFKSVHRDADRLCQHRKSTDHDPCFATLQNDIHSLQVAQDNVCTHRGPSACNRASSTCPPPDCAFKGRTGSAKTKNTLLLIEPIDFIQRSCLGAWDESTSRATDPKKKKAPFESVCSHFA